MDFVPYELHKPLKKLKIKEIAKFEWSLQCPLCDKWEKFEYKQLKGEESIDCNNLKCDFSIQRDFRNEI